MDIVDRYGRLHAHHGLQRGYGVFNHDSVVIPMWCQEFPIGDNIGITCVDPEDITIVRWWVYSVNVHILAVNGVR